MTTLACAVGGTVLIAMSGVALARAAAQDKAAREDYTSGAYLYRVYCASCHGSSGRGDGPVADLGPRRPPDLTALTKLRGGVFPRAEVRDVLDGTKPAAGHDPTEMPRWRDVLRAAERGDERAIRARLDALLAHVEALQR